MGTRPRVLLRAATLTTAALVTVALGAAPATAGPEPDPASKVPNAEFFLTLIPKGTTLVAGVSAPRPKGSTVKMVNGAETDAVLWCVANTGPNPQYSPDPSRIHWGFNTNCNHVTGLHLKGQLFNQIPGMPYEITGPEVPRNVVSNYYWVGDVNGCFNGGSSKFRATYWGSTDSLGNLLPYPAYSATPTHPCV